MCRELSSLPADMTSHARLSFSVPKPPTKHSTRDNPDETVTWVNKRLRGLLAAFKQQSADADPYLALDAYMVIYSTIHDVTVTKTEINGEPPAKKLYDDLAGIVRSHYKDLRIDILQSQAEAAIDQDVAIMQAYAREWKRYCKLGKMVAHNYRYLERHWVRREMDVAPEEKRKPGVHLFNDLLMIIWRDEVAIGNSQFGQSPNATNADGLESILDVAVRLRDKEGLASGHESGPRASDTLREVFGSFDELKVSFGTSPNTRAYHRPQPEIVVKQEILRSGLEITVRELVHGPEMGSDGAGNRHRRRAREAQMM